MERLVAERFASVTLDFDGSVLSTGRHAEGTAVGFNKKKKGARSYYPLFCTVAQTDQVLDVHHRPGNVHDSNGADTFIEHCVRTVRASLPRAKIEVRIDSAFFNQAIVGRLHSLGAKFTKRFAGLKEMVEGRRRWRPMAGGLGYFETRWMPKSNTRYRFIFIRRPMPEQSSHSTRSFQPRIWIRVQGHRDQQQDQSTQGRSLPRRTGVARGNLCRAPHCQMGYVPVKTRVGNQLYMFAGILAHNLTRELQMRLSPRARRTTANVPRARNRNPSTRRASPSR